MTPTRFLTAFVGLGTGAPSPIISFLNADLPLALLGRSTLHVTTYRDRLFGRDCGS
ncbi:MAG TPA: hypothetical protein VF908_09420 [Gemmatimonadaceae bacterium]